MYYWLEFTTVLYNPSSDDITILYTVIIKLVCT